MKEIVILILVFVTIAVCCSYRPTPQEEQQFQAYKAQRAIDRYENAVSEAEYARRRAIQVLNNDSK